MDKLTIVDESSRSIMNVIVSCIYTRRDRATKDDGINMFKNGLSGREREDKDRLMNTDR